jgi:hypothetical protein
VVIVLQVHGLERDNRRDLLKHGAHVLDVTHRECPTHVLGRMRRVASGGQVLTPHRVVPDSDGEQGNGSISEVRQVALTELHEGQVGSPLQHVIEVISHGRSEPRHQARVRGVRQDIHVDLTTPMTELAVQAAVVCRGPCEAKAVQHIPKQGGEAGMVQSITMESSVSTKDDVRLAIHLSKQRRNESTFHPSNRGNNKTEHNLNNKNLTQFCKVGQNMY